MTQDMHDRTSELASQMVSRRRSLGLTQAEAAELAGVSTRFVHMAENGKGSVRLDKLVALLDVLGLELKAVARGTR